MDYYDSGYKTIGKKRALLWIITRYIFFVVSVVAALTLALTLLAPIVSPEVWRGFSILGLIAPFIYITNFVVAMVLVIRLKWRFAIPIIILLLLGSGNISRFAKMNINKQYNTSNYRGTVKVMSYNLRSHVRDDKQWSSGDIANYLDYVAPDIFCAQELRSQKFEENLPSKFKNYNRATYCELGIYTRYPIIQRSQEQPPLGVKGEISYSMWVDVKIGGDTLRIFNFHLTSTMISDDDNRYLSQHKFLADSLREERVADILHRFNHSSVHRARHADSLKQVLDSSPHQFIVCGDFNDTPMSYTYNRLSKGLKDSFKECGEGYIYTYRGFMNTLRIDYILGSQGVNFKSYDTDWGTTLSDHLPIIARFSLN